MLSLYLNVFSMQDSVLILVYRTWLPSATEIEKEHICKFQVESRTLCYLGFHYMTNIFLFQNVANNLNTFIVYIF